MERGLEGEDRALFGDGVKDPAWNRDNYYIRNYYKFAVVRNPWDRFISSWKYLGSTRDRSIEDVLMHLPSPNLIGNIFSFQSSAAARYSYASAFGRILKTNISAVVRTKLLGRQAGKPPRSRGHDYRHITRQQCETLFYSDGDVIVDRIVYFEHLHDGMREVCKDIGMKFDGLPFLNKNRSRDDYRRYFNEKSMQLFNERFPDDIDVWGYEFDTAEPTRPVEAAGLRLSGFAAARPQPGGAAAGGGAPREI